MGNAICLRSVLRAALWCAPFLCAAAEARTFERFNFSAGAGAGLYHPQSFFGEAFGNAFVFLGPGVDLFENRLSLQLDLGVSNTMSHTWRDDFGYDTYEPRGDTLYRTQTDYEYRDETLRGVCAYTGALNFGPWTFFAGEAILMQLAEVTRTGTVRRAYALGDSLDVYHEVSNRPYQNRFRFGLGSVFPVYGASRRFGRTAVFLQGIGIFSIQAGLRVSLRKLGTVAPHR